MEFISCEGKTEFSVSLSHMIFQKSFQYADLVVK